MDYAAAAESVVAARDSPLVIRVEGLSKCYHIYERPQDRLKQAVLPRLARAARAFGARRELRYFREFWALRSVSFEVRRGESMAILGRNGAGKSTLLQLIAGTLTATSGRAVVQGRVAALLELGSGFNPEFTGRENVFLNASLLGLSEDQTRERFDDIASFADIGPFMEQPVKTYSSGMMMRLAFAVQTAVQPEVLIVDEALSVGDARFQKKCFARFETYRAAGGTVLFVTHDSGLVSEVCSKAMILEQGEVYDQGEPHRIVREYHKLLFGSEVARVVGGTESTSAQQVLRTAGESRPEDSGSATQVESAMAATSATKVRYGSRDVQIMEVGIRDVDGLGAVTLETNRQYDFYFRVRYTKPIVENVSYGIVLTSKRGIDLFGTKSALHGDFLPPGAPGAEFECLYRAKLVLVPGTYFLTVAVAPADESGGQDRFYDCWFDAMELRVIGSPSCFLSGVLDLDGRLTHRVV